MATISDGVDIAVGACIDGHGTLYVTNEPITGLGWVSEYPLGKTKPSEIITDGVKEPGSCAIDADGNLWIANIYGPNVTEYLYGAKKPHRVITNGLAYPLGSRLIIPVICMLGTGLGLRSKTWRCTLREVSRHRGRSPMASLRRVDLLSMRMERCM